MFQVKGWFGLGFDFKWDPYTKSTRVTFYSFELHFQAAFHRSPQHCLKINLASKSQTNAVFLVGLCYTTSSAIIISMFSKSRADFLKILLYIFTLEYGEEIIRGGLQSKIGDMCCR